MQNIDGYEPVIGLEVHAQLATDSKIFCSCGVTFADEPNSRTCPVCLGLPGVLPVLNEKAVELAVRIVLVIGGSVQPQSVFARKNYFYPDLPKGYQISQYELPIGQGGHIDITSPDGDIRPIGIERIHLEEDAGKLTHDAGSGDVSLLDLNRCGVGLVEIVSQPDMHTPEEAYAYLSSLKQLLQWIEVSSADMEKGELRCDANISVRKVGARAMGVRTEIKNLNSFKAVRRALEYEFQRQVDLLRYGCQVEQATLLWNEKEHRAELMRTKEESQDYRYFPEPDLLTLSIPKEQVEDIRTHLPALPKVRSERLVDLYGIRPYDAAILTASRELADYADAVLGLVPDPVAATNWLVTEIPAILRETGEAIETFPVSPPELAELLTAIQKRVITAGLARKLIDRALSSSETVTGLLSMEEFSLLVDGDGLLTLVDTVLGENAAECDRYRAGKTQVLDFFIGQVMHRTRGRSDPVVVRELVKQRLDKNK